MQEAIWELLGITGPPFLHWGLLRVREAKISKSKSYAEVKSGQYDGWADPRTWSIASLDRRGISPEAIRRFTLSFGLSLADIEVPAETLYAENRAIIDATTPRRAYVPEPMLLEIAGYPEGLATVELANHPEHPEMGRRSAAAGPNVLPVASRPGTELGSEVRLKDLANIQPTRRAPCGPERRRARRVHEPGEPADPAPSVGGCGRRRRGAAARPGGRWHRPDRRGGARAVRPRAGRPVRARGVRRGSRQAGYRGNARSVSASGTHSVPQRLSTRPADGRGMRFLHTSITVRNMEESVRVLHRRARPRVRTPPADPREPRRDRVRPGSRERGTGRAHVLGREGHVRARRAARPPRLRGGRPGLHARRGAGPWRSHRQGTVPAEGRYEPDRLPP